MTLQAEWERIEKRIDSIIGVLLSYKGFSEAWNNLGELNKSRIRQEIRRIIQYG